MEQYNHLKEAQNWQENREDELKRNLPHRISDDDYAPPPAQPERWAKSPESALDEAAHIITGPRRALYGHPWKNHSRTARLWSAYLGTEVTAEQVCMLNILQKISRDVNKPDRENIVDIIGYAANIDIIGCHKDESR